MTSGSFSDSFEKSDPAPSGISPLATAYSISAKSPA
jgi:hypothetical protein